MSKVTRRNAMVFGAGAPMAGFAVPGIGGETDTTVQGINIKLFWNRYGKNKGWNVMVPDWENIVDGWHPGIPVPWKSVKLAEYLQAMEDEFKLVPTS